MTDEMYGKVDKTFPLHLNFMHFYFIKHFQISTHYINEMVVISLHAAWNLAM